MNPKFIKRAANKATQSICKYHVAALGLNRDGICIAAKTNMPFLDKKGGGLHAEARIMREAKKKGIVKIIICRVGNGGNLLPIHPCSRCQATANKLGIIIETILS